MAPLIAWKDFGKNICARVTAICTMAIKTDEKQNNNFRLPASGFLETVPVPEFCVRLQVNWVSGES